MVWACFKNEWRQNPKEGFEPESKRKMTKTEIKIKMGILSSKSCHTEGMKSMGGNWGGGA
jgi:hypothetical protein